MTATSITEPVTTAPPVAVYEPAPDLTDVSAVVAAGEIALCLDGPLPADAQELTTPVELHGWVYSPVGIAAVWLVVDGRTWVQAVHGQSRLDVVGALGIRDADRSGYRALLMPSDCPPGAREITVVAIDRTGAAVGRTVTLEIAETRATDGPPVKPETPSAVPQEQIDGNGERYVPEQHDGAIEAEHQARYRWASALAEGSEVLDAGCGVGWGTALLAAAGARRTVGLDVHPRALENARARVGDAAEFVQGDLAALPFEDASFDVVVCFEAIEHVADPERALDELRRVLRPGGTLAISSPNRGVYPAGNPYHLREYASAELEQSLRTRFAHVCSYRQQTHLGSLLIEDGGFAVADAGAPLDAAVRKTHGQAPGEELYLVALASDEPPPALPGVAVLADPLDVKGYVEVVAEWQHRTLLAEAERSTAFAEVGVARFELDRALALLQATEQRVHDAEQRQVAAERRLDELRASTSWRITAPLRDAKRLVSRVKR